MLMTMGMGYSSAFNRNVYLYNIFVYKYNNGIHQLIGNITFGLNPSLMGMIQVSPQLTKIYITYRNDYLNATYNLLYNVNFESNNITQMRPYNTT